MENIVYVVRTEIYSVSEDTQVDFELYKDFKDAFSQLNSLSEEWLKLEEFSDNPWISDRREAHNKPSFYIDDAQGNSRSAEIFPMIVK